MFRSLKRSDESDKKQQMLQPRYTMRGFEWKDQRGVEGTGFVRALRSLMTAQLPKLLPSLRHALENEIAAELGHGRLVDGKPLDIVLTISGLLTPPPKERRIYKSSHR